MVKRKDAISECSDTSNLLITLDFSPSNMQAQIERKVHTLKHGTELASGDYIG
jgi:hypothetical protein